MKKLIIYTILIAGLFSNLYGIDSSALLFNSFNAETIGRGDVNVAWLNDSDFLGNPAILGNNKNIALSLSYWKYILDMNFMNSVIIYNISDKIGTLGLNLNMFDSGEFVLYDSMGNSSENISGKNIIFTLGYSINSLFIKHLNLGLSVKYVNNSLYTTSAKTIAFDFGVLYGMNLIKFGIKRKSAGNNFFIGFSILNAGNGIKYSSEKTSLPMNFKVGIMHNVYENNIINVKYGLDTTYIDSDININTGFELYFIKMVCLRAGYSIDNDISGFNTGLGLRYNKDDVSFNFNYTIVPMSDFGLTHNVSLNIVINKNLFGMERAETKNSEVE